MDSGGEVIELFEQNLKQFDRHSSKGNQLKWENEGIWYKADYTGYEGLSEYVVSNLLRKSTLNEDEFVVYDLEQIKYKHSVFNGAKSRDMLSDDWQIITLERAYKKAFGESLYEKVWKIHDVEKRLEFLVNTVIRMTGIKDFGIYLSKLLTIDAVFLNEDRHLHNIAILMNGNMEYALCPIFDNGGALLSDTKLDYPMSEDTIDLMAEVKSKTISQDFDEQLDAVEKLFGKTIKFNFEKKDVDSILDKVTIYSKEEIERVRTIMYQQIRKYRYLMR